MRRLVEGTLPALADGNATVRIDVEKDIVPAFAFEPITKRHCISIVLSRMTQKNARHDNFPIGTLVLRDNLDENSGDDQNVKRRPVAKS